MVEHVAISLPRLPAAFDGITVAVISDVHARPQGGLRALEEVVETTNGLRPDVVLLLGDIVHYANEDVGHLAALAGLRANEGVYACLGNHEHGFVWYSRYVGPGAHPSADEWREIYAAAGIDLLVNEASPLARGYSRIWLLGVDDAYSGCDDLSAALAQSHEGGFRLVLTHSPDVLDSPGIEKVDLLIAGHTHGGQVLLPGLGPVFGPCRHFRQRAAGLVRTRGTIAYVTRGVGESLPIRLGCPRQLPLMALSSDRPS